ncbi:stage II sporulation protein M [Microbulbifer thermotolerans]|uniref:stage II sporulation protein M n=1 Tax=Microbulbifer thermotolerans TaxID=252514 RepID=UPI00224B2FD9|nr:stage II sporulation protein M [Microbulbifer thermotolerans]MCX2780679.1 stage II sporulation protein M [Microbulbifer thermotolerans]MCX2806333.1 stage II sporulation protein M [Microbulbifer thermotolerans]
MKQRDFEQRYRASWERLEKWLKTGADGTTTLDLPVAYRSVCQQLAVAKERQYTNQLIERLNQLVMAAHHRLYRQQTLRRNTWLRYLLSGFPQAVRAQIRTVWLAAALFVLPALVLGIGSYHNDALVYAVLDPIQVRQMEAMYDPGNRVLGRERGSDSDLMMFGFYIKNNIGIAFRTFAGGLLLGLGSIFFLVYNGIFLGAICGHITRIGFVSTFYPFVIGHGAFELTAIVLAGAAGLMLGQALVDPGRHRRLVALRLAGTEAMKIMYGTFLMLVIAAFIEAFWSSSTEIAISVKLAVGALLWLLVFAYFTLAGREGTQRGA